MLVQINLHTHLSNKDEMHKETDGTDDKNEDLSPHGSTKPPWKHVNGRGDEALHWHKLKHAYIYTYTLVIDRFVSKEQLRQV